MTEYFRLQHGSQVPVIPDDMVPSNRGAVSFWTHVKRNGDWVMPRTFRIIAFMGGAELDLSHALFGAGESTIELRCVWGGIEIIVPDDIFVDCDVDSVAGAAEVKRESVTRALPGAPTLRIRGFVAMGGVEVKVRARD